MLGFNYYLLCFRGRQLDVWLFSLIYVGVAYLYCLALRHLCGLFVVICFGFWVWLLDFTVFLLGVLVFVCFDFVVGGCLAVYLLVVFCLFCFDLMI